MHLYNSRWQWCSDHYWLFCIIISLTRRFRSWVKNCTLWRFAGTLADLYSIYLFSAPRVDSEDPYKILVTSGYPGLPVVYSLDRGHSWISCEDSLTLPPTTNLTVDVQLRVLWVSFESYGRRRVLVFWQHACVFIIHHFIVHRLLSKETGLREFRKLALFSQLLSETT